MVRPLGLSQALRRVPQQARSRVHAPARFASSTPGSSTEAAQKKAQDALASAQKFASEASAKGKQALGPVGERLGNLLGGMFQYSVVHRIALAYQARELHNVLCTDAIPPVQATSSQFCTISQWHESSSSRSMLLNGCNPLPLLLPSPMRIAPSGPACQALLTGGTWTLGSGPRSEFTLWRLSDCIR